MPTPREFPVFQVSQQASPGRTSLRWSFEACGTKTDKGRGFDSGGDRENDRRFVPLADALGRRAGELPPGEGGQGEQPAPLPPLPSCVTSFGP